MAVAMFFGTAHTVLGQVVVEIRPTARLDADQPVTLGAIAELSGPDSDAWRDLAVAESPSEGGMATGTQTVGVEQVRDAMQRRSGVNWAGIVIRGSACTVMRPAPRSAVNRPVVSETLPAPTREGPCVRTLAIERLGQILGVAPADLRVSFLDQDREVLEMPVQGRVVEIHTVGKSDRVSLSVRVFEGERILVEEVLRADVEVNREVVVAVGQLGRGTPLGGSNTIVEKRWIGAAEQPAEPAAVVGMVSRGRIKPGQVITLQDVEPPLVVERGDLVNIDCLSGGVVLQRMMRAAESGRIGEVVEFQTVEGKKVVRARINSRGRAVMVLDSTVAAGARATPSGTSIPDSSPGVEEVRVGGLTVSRGGGQSLAGSSMNGRPTGKRAARFSNLADAKVESRPGSAGGRGAVR
ncbi:MAG: hypothetical protein AMXMBFR58_18290 [Phycisphaerae bacterium]